MRLRRCWLETCVHFALHTRLCGLDDMYGAPNNDQRLRDDIPVAAVIVSHKLVLWRGGGGVMATVIMVMAVVSLHCTPSKFMVDYMTAATTTTV